METTRIQRALLSVSDKTGLDKFAKGLVAQNVQLISTGGTCRYLQELGLPVTEISDYTGAPELFDGRVKTLHPKVTMSCGKAAGRSRSRAVVPLPL